LSVEHQNKARERGLLNDEFAVFIDEGLLLCRPCSTWFPVTRGLPILLPYTTQLHKRFFDELEPSFKRVIADYKEPAGPVVPGERLVMQSFSTEWLAYHFDGVIWEMDYTDHEQRFLRELDLKPGQRTGPFLELGCGIGISTALAQKNFDCDCVGVDLSLAAVRATEHYQSNPFLLFVQASVYALPFESMTFNMVYTRGVLHHTYSTRKAFESLSRLCRIGGLYYVWVYGLRSFNDNLFRRIVYGLEVVLRWLLNRSPHWVADVVLAPIALSYQIFNAVRRLGNNRIQPYSYRRALHAARDRFTPEFAFRQDADEVGSWFRERGFDSITVVDWRAMPSADHEDFRRNTGVRAVRATAPAD
jgi:ubiquinone/menaquinone biosynthesis C-methylase UbiE/uncharacterized protein YbaR (Trm112 family)